jgi:hypothetical protein
VYACVCVLVFVSIGYDGMSPFTGTCLPTSPATQHAAAEQLAGGLYWRLTGRYASSEEQYEAEEAAHPMAGGVGAAASGTTPQPGGPTETIALRPSPSALVGHADGLATSQGDGGDAYQPGDWRQVARRVRALARPPPTPPGPGELPHPGTEGEAAAIMLALGRSRAVSGRCRGAACCAIVLLPSRPQSTRRTSIAG